MDKPQVNEDWQHCMCAILGHFVRSNRLGWGGPDVLLTRPLGVKSIGGDGNCLFRCLSYVLTGSQEQYHEVRTKICDHLVAIVHFMLEHHMPSRFTRCINCFLQLNTVGNVGELEGEDKLMFLEVEQMEAAPDPPAEPEPAPAPPLSPSPVPPAKAPPRASQPPPPPSPPAAPPLPPRYTIFSHSVCLSALSLPLSLSLSLSSKR